MNAPHVLLVNPWIYDFAAYDFWVKPLGLLSLAGMLEHCGYQTSLIDCLDRYHPLQAEGIGKYKATHRKNGTGKFHRTPVDKPAFFADIPRPFCRYGIDVDVFIQTLQGLPKPNVVFVTSMMTYWYPGVFLAIRLIREHLPGVPVVLGGIYATLCTDHARRFSGADYIITGEGELQALELLEQLTHFHPRVNHIPQRWPDFPDPLFRYYRQLPALVVMTSRGCPFRCSFCASHFLNGAFIQRQPQRIVDTIQWHYHKRHIRHVVFYDEALLVRHRHHFDKILKRIRDLRLPLLFHTPNGIHAREITPELAKLMYDTQFRTIRVSYESASKERQAEMLYKVTDETLANSIDYFEAVGFRRRDIDVYVIMGLPEQPLEEVIASMIFVASLGAKIRLTSFSPIPGTKDWERAIVGAGFPADADPLLTNNTAYPLRNADADYSDFQQLRQLAKVLNYSLDQGINLFNTSRVAKLVQAYLRQSPSSETQSL